MCDSRTRGDSKLSDNPVKEFTIRFRASQAPGVGVVAVDPAAEFQKHRRCVLVRWNRFAEGKETREFDGRIYVMERGLRADFAFVKAWKGDREGNLIYRKTARNFNPMIATAAKITIAEVEHLIDVGELDGDQIHTPSIYVKRIFQGELYERRIERRTVRKVASGQ